jgi:hypothetical protein
MGTLYNADHTPIEIRVVSLAESQDAWRRWIKREAARGYAEAHLAHDSRDQALTYAERMVKAALSDLLA